jgi:hypothetical protein
MALTIRQQGVVNTTRALNQTVSQIVQIVLCPMAITM